ncbi:MAG TPA: VWA domain-containing protein, partial [Terriglobia bacterium]|nr:VWA domain-containing protein [Terriglobia bacterium]
LLAGLASASPKLAAQGPSPGAAPTTTIKVEVKQVLVPVVVTDRRGHNIVGLKPGDFQVLEDGDPQTLTSFGTASAPGETLPAVVDSQPASVPASAPAARPAAPAPRRDYLICLDTLNSAFENFATVRGALHKLFKQEEGSDARYALVALGRQPVIVENLTADPGRILAALGSKELNKAIEQSESSNLASQESELIRALGDYCQQCPCAGAAAAATRTSGGSGQICDGKRKRVEMWAESAADERTMLTRDFLHNVRELESTLAAQPGKRIFILISDGFNLRPGRDLFGLIAAYLQDPSELVNNRIEDLEPEVQEILRLATARNVTFYTLDSRGLYTSPAGGYDASGEYQMTRVVVLMPQVQEQKDTAALENQDAMRELAATTGGVFFHNSNDLLKGMRQAIVDGREYYLLSYVSTHKSADGKFHAIVVHVKGKDLVVRAKRGYWASAGG